MTAADISLGLRIAFSMWWLLLAILVGSGVLLRFRKVELISRFEERYAKVTQVLAGLLLTAGAVTNMLPRSPLSQLIEIAGTQAMILYVAGVVVIHSVAVIRSRNANRFVA